MPIQVTNVRDDFAFGSTRTIKLLAVGPPGVGKTRSASTWPNVIYADIEGRLLSVRDRNVRRARILALSDIDELKAMLGQKPEVRAKMLGGPVDTVVIDTVDELSRLIIKERLRSERQEVMRMQDWGYLGDTLRNLLRGFRNLDDLNVIFNCHLKSSEDSESGRIEKKPDIQGSVGHEIAAYVDEAFLLVAKPYTDPTTGVRTIKRYFQTYPDSAHEWVKDHSGCLPMELAIDFETDYERMAKLIFGDEPPQAPPPLTVDTIDAAPERTQVALSTSVDPLASIPTMPEAPVAKRRGRPPKDKSQVIVDVNLPEPEPAPLPDPVPEPTPEPVPQKETAIAEPVASGDPVCAECGVTVDNPEVAELSDVRFGVVLCRDHFVERRNKK